MLIGYCMLMNIQQSDRPLDVALVLFCSSDASFDLRYGVGILCLKERLYNPTNLSPVIATDPRTQ